MILRIMARGLMAGALVACGAPAMAAQSGPYASPSATRPVTVPDLVRWRQFQPGIALSPDGTYVAYVLREPNLAANVNELVLYVLRLPAPGQGGTVARGRGREVFRTQGLGHESPTIHFQWLATSRAVLVLHQPAGEPRPIVSRVDLVTGRQAVIYRSNVHVTAFAANARGDRLVVTGTVPSSRTLDRFRSPRGVLMGPDDERSDPRGVAMYETRLYPESAGTPELRVVAVGGASVSLGRFTATSLTMSPDGQYLAFSASDSSMVTLVALPPTLTADSARRDTTGLLVSWPARVLLPATGASVLRWSPDGSTVLVKAGAPVGTRFAPTSRPVRGEHDCSWTVICPIWAIDVASGAFAQVLGEGETEPGALNVLRRVEAVDSAATRVAVWYPKGELVILRRPPGPDRTALWTEERRIPTARLVSRNSADLTTVNDRILVGVRQTTSIPPDLYVQELATGRRTLLTEINPEFRRQQLGRTELIEWSDSVGRYYGHIVYPADYAAGTRYPCAILAKSWDRESFIYEGQDGYRAGNFPAQALAGSGILVFLLANYRPVGEEGWEIPGGSVAHHAYFGARRRLAARGLIDPARCGIMGFSHTAFEVPFLVTHPGEDPPWAAAVAADGGLGNYATYLMGYSARDLRGEFLADDLHSADAPKTHDAGRAVFLRRSPAWNAQAARTPLLQHRHGHTPGGGLEVYKNLWIRGKPVELWWYPDAAHTLTLPVERESAMQRMVDWFRFWLQGYERSGVADDPARYVRWRALRSEHQRNERWIAEGKDPAVEFVRQLETDMETP